MEILNDLDKQYLKNNSKLIRQVAFERQAKNAISAVNQFRETFNECYESDGTVNFAFDEVLRYLGCLGQLQPYCTKRKR